MTQHHIHHYLPCLSPPNLIHSLASSILTHAELHSIPTTAVFSFTSPHYIAASLAAFHCINALLPSHVRSAADVDETRWEREWREVMKGVEKERKNGRMVTGGSGGYDVVSSLLHSATHDMFL